MGAEQVGPVWATCTSTLFGLAPARAVDIRLGRKHHVCGAGWASVGYLHVDTAAGAASSIRFFALRKLSISLPYRFVSLLCELSISI